MPRRRTVAAAFALIAIAVGFLLPSVARVKQAAAKSNCSNNLKMMGVAFHNYASANNDLLPPGTMASPALPIDQRLSLNVQLLPYIESGTPYHMLAKSEAWDSPTNNSLIDGFHIKLFRCPAWADGRELPWDARSPTSYIGVGGIGLDSPGLALENSRCGLLGWERQRSIMKVKDGLENTALTFETAREPGPWMRGGTSTLRGLDPIDLPIAGDDRQIGGMHRPSSFALIPKKPGGANVLAGDGSVRFVSDSVDTAIFLALATAAGGEDLNANW